jgi:peptide/nickel transport system permease protein
MGDWAHLVLPTITLGTALAAVLVRMIRSSMVNELSRPYVITARAKGLSRRRVIYLHALKNGLMPVVTILGLQFGGLLAGAIITETIFSWQGIGRLMIQSIQSRDYPLIQSCILAISVTYIAINLLTDLVYSFLDPRVRY